MTTTPRTWVVGEVVSAALLNTEIRDQFNSFFGAWSNYAPEWGATGTAPALGNGTISGRYMKFGRNVHFEIKLIAGSTSTYGSGSWNFTLPSTSATKNTDSLPVARMFDVSANANYSAIGQITTNDTRCRFFAVNSGTGLVAAGTPFTWAASDELRIAGTYEAAA